MAMSDCEKAMCGGIALVVLLQLIILARMPVSQEGYGYRGGFQGMGASNRQMNEGATW
jgi:hypothetical protein